jgi:hopene-associated glycosyltransferase HpnB
MGLVLAGAASVATWLYLLFGRGGFWHMREAPPEGTLPIPPPSVVAVIPARDEAPVVGQAVASLAAQHYPGAFHIVLADDDSCDGTADAASAAASYERLTPDLLTVVRANPLPKGWTGKLWALSEGIGAAQAFDPEYLLLTDADIVHPPDNVAALLARATSGGYDLVSYMVMLRCRTFAEQALIPAFVFFFFMLYPPAWVPRVPRSPHHSTAAAAGGCILIRRQMLESLGGIARIRGQLIDDCALARAVQEAGGRVWLGLSPATRSIRAYAGFAEIGLMISRTAFTQLGHSTLLLLATALALVLAYLVPPAFTLWAPPGAARGLAAIAWLLMSIAYWPALRYYGRPLWWAPGLPLVAAFYLGATLHSAVAYWRGAGGMWKGRAQDAV